MKTILASLDEVPEPLRVEYESRDGKFHLKLEGDVPGHVPAAQLAEANGKVVEFRDRTTSLLKGIAELAGVSEASDLSPLKAKMEAFNGFDVEKYKAMEAKIAEFQKKGVKGADDIQVQIKSALNDYHKSAVEPLQSQLTSEREGRAAAQALADKSLLRQTIGEQYLKVGGRPGVMDFILSKAEEPFEVVGNEVKARGNKFSPANPANPLSIDEWLAGTMKENPFAFEVSAGGGAAGSGSAGSGGRPGAKQLVDPTPQELGGLKYVSGKGLVDKAGQVVEIKES